MVLKVVRLESLKHGISWFEFKKANHQGCYQRLYKISLSFIYWRINCVSPKNKISIDQVHEQASRNPIIKGINELGCVT